MEDFENNGINDDFATLEEVDDFVDMGEVALDADPLMALVGVVLEQIAVDILDDAAQ